MLNMKWILVFSLLCSYTGALTQEGTADDPVVAEVNDTKIFKSTLYKYHTQNLNFVRDNKQVTLESSLDDLINRIVGIDKAKKNNLHKNPEVIKKMNDVVYHAQISKDLEPVLEKIQVSDKEVEDYYKNNPEYRTAQILYRLPVTPPQDEVKKALDQSLALYNEAKKNPENFMKLAERFSQSTTAQIGGDLGYQPRTRLTPEFYEQIKNKKPGFITQPFRTQYGVHIVKVLGVKTYDQIDKNMYKKIIYDVKRDKILEDYFRKERTNAKIKINKQHLN
jgi:parvulin-like peptidyl-prolyl isomerase